MRGQPSLCAVLRPGDLGEALDLLRAEPSLRPFAGGTDLMVPFAAGTLPDTRFLDLRGLQELRGIEVAERTVILGALTTFSEVRRHPVLADLFPNLVRSAEVTGAVAIQNRGTLGGNIVNGSPAGDSLPSLLAYDADVELRSASGARWLSYAAFHLGYKRNALAPGELLTRILLRRPETPGFHYFRKVGTRAAQAIAKVSLALHAEGRDGTLATFRASLGAVGPVPLRAARVEALLRGEPLDGLPVREALAALQEDIAPIDDLRSTAKYRRTVAGNLLGEALGAMLRELGRP